MVFNSVKHIDNAVSKSRIKGHQFVFRGVSDLKWFGRTNIGDSFKHNAFGSYSLKIENALKYTNPTDPVLFQLGLDDKMKALYVDSAEFEILRPRNAVYIIRDISKEHVPILNHPEKKITIYHTKKF